MSYENYFDSVSLPIGYVKDLDKPFIVGNILGYSSAINNVVQWAGYTVSALAYGILVSRVVGVVRIVLSLIVLCNTDRDDVDWYQVRNSYTSQVLRGAAEIAGLAPALIIADIIITLYLCDCRSGSIPLEPTAVSP